MKRSEFCTVSGWPGLVIGAALLAALSHPRPLLAQSLEKRDAGDVPVRVVLIDSLPLPGTDGLIIRRPAPVGDLLLVVPGQSEDAVVAAGLLILRQARMVQGDAVGREMFVRVSLDRLPATLRGHNSGFGRLVLGRVRASETAEVPGLAGGRRSALVWLPAQGKDQRPGKPTGP